MDTNFNYSQLSHLSQLSQAFLGLLFISLVDGLYLYNNKDFYDSIIDKNEKINITFVILSWIVIIIGINLLVLSRPDINKNNSFIYGAYLGLISYALWNCTNYSIYPSKWSIKILMVDSLWGAILTGSTSYMMYNYFGLNKPLA